MGPIAHQYILMAMPLRGSNAGSSSHRHAGEIRAQRTVTLDTACAANPARFRHRRPTPPKLPSVAWINEPSPEALIEFA